MALNRLSIKNYYLLVQAVTISVLCLMPIQRINASNSCKSVYKNSFLTSGNADLFKIRESEISNLSPNEIKNLNNELLTKITAYSPNASVNRVQSISYRQAQATLEAIRKHEVVGLPHVQKYENSNFLIGYCFGRAAFAHLALLKMGLQKESILKIWSVGPQKITPTSEIIWGFHVSALVFTKNKGWVALDTDFKNPVPVNEWIKQQESLSTDGKVRFYVTEPSKFSISLDKYSRLQMGLDLPRDKDLYFGYFQDLLKSLRTRTLNELELPKLSQPHLDKEPVLPSESAIINGERIWF